MPFNIFKRTSKYSKDQISEIKRKARDFINPHINNFHKIIRSITKSYPRFNKHYEVDDNPNINFMEYNFTVGWSLTFSGVWDTSDDECNSKIMDPNVIDKMFEMENRIIKELQRYCEENGLEIKFVNNNKNWDDAGIYCTIDANALTDAKNESSIFESVEFI